MKLYLCIALILIFLSGCGQEVSTKPPENPPVPAQEESIDPEAIQTFDCGSLTQEADGTLTGRENFEEFLNLTGVGKDASIDIVLPENAFMIAYRDGAYLQLPIPSSSSDSKSSETWQYLVIAETADTRTFRLSNLPADQVTPETPDGTDVQTLFSESLAIE